MAAEWTVEVVGEVLAELSSGSAEAPIFTAAQHSHITTAVPTSLVCPLSGIAGLSERSPSPQLCCFTLHSVSSHLLRSPRLWPAFELICDLWGLFGYRSCGITSLTGRTICDNFLRDVEYLLENLTRVGPRGSTASGTIFRL